MQPEQVKVPACIDYASVMAGSYRTNLTFDEYTLRPHGAKGNDQAFASLSVADKSLLPRFEEAYRRVQQGEGMAAVILPLVAALPDMTVSGESLRVLLCKTNETLLLQPQMELFKSMSAVTKAGSVITATFNAPKSIPISLPQLFNGARIVCSMPTTLSLRHSFKNGESVYSFIGTRPRVRVGVFPGEIQGFKVDKKGQVTMGVGYMGVVMEVKLVGAS
jgi:hypothetical protein